MRPAVQIDNRQLVALGIVVLAVAGASLLGQAIVREDYRDLAVTLAFGIGGFLSIFIFRDWRLGVVLFFVWAVFEDMLRKFLGNAMMVYATKDLIMLAAYASFLLALAQRKETTMKNPLRVPLLAFVAWVFIETLNPYLENYQVPLLGLRMTLFYVPLLYLGYSFLKKEEQLRNFWFLMLGIAGLTSCLGIIQSVVGLDFLNPDSAPHLRLFLTRFAPGSGAAVPRPTGPFVGSGRFAQYMLVMAYVGLGIVAYFYHTARTTKRAIRFLAWCCWAIVMIGLFLSGQRAAILWIVLSLVGMFFLRLFIEGRIRAGKAFPLGRVLLTGAGVMLMVFALFPERFESAYHFYADTIDPFSQYSEFSSRPRTHLRETVYSWEQSGWLGHGTGSSSLGRQYVAPLLPEAEAYKFRDQVESGYAVVLWEWGIVGLALWLWWSLLLLKLMIQTVWGLRSSRFFWLAATIAICIFVILFPSIFMGMQIYQNYMTQAFLWFLIGMLFRFPHLLAADPQGALLDVPARPREWAHPVPSLAQPFHPAHRR